MKNIGLEPITKNIIITASRLEHIADKYIFEPMGLSAITVKILNILTEMEPLSPTQIMEKLGGTKSNISQRLNLLQKKGFIERVYARETADKRKIAIQMTKTGRKKWEEIIETFKARSMDHLHKCFTAAELEAHHRFHAKLNSILDDFENQVGCRRHCIKSNPK